MAAVIHLAVLRARYEERQPNESELAACFTPALATGLGVAPDALFASIPSLGELSGGLEELVN